MTDRYNAANNWETTINEAGGIDNIETSFTVSSTAGHPTVPFKITVDDEIMDVTAVNGTTLTVVRGREGTSGAPHDDGAVVENRFTAEVQNNLWDAVDGHIENTTDAHGIDAKADDTDLTAHVNATSVHGAVSAATADRIIIRDANGRARVGAPDNDADIARKQDVDAKPSLGELSNEAYRGDRGATAYDHSQAETGAEHGAVSSATNNMIIRRDSSGRARVSAPDHDDDIATKGYVAPKTHNLVDTTNHPVTGLTAGHVLTASDATTYGFALPQMSEIATTTLAEAAASITFSSIPATYKHLSVVGISRTSRAGTVDLICVRLNSDTGTNYHMHFLDVSEDVVAGYQVDGADHMEVAYTNGANATAGNVGSLEILIFNYANTTFRKRVHVSSGAKGADAGHYSGYGFGAWESTSAVTTILLYPTHGPNFAIGTTFTLYGIK